MQCSDCKTELPKDAKSCLECGARVDIVQEGEPIQDDAVVVGGLEGDHAQIGAALRPGGAVIAEGHQGKWFEGLGGVSLYAVSPRLQRVSPFYTDVALAKETRWGKMLEAYHDAL